MWGKTVVFPLVHRRWNQIKHAGAGNIPYFRKYGQNDGGHQTARVLYHKEVVS